MIAHIEPTNYNEQTNPVIPIRPIDFLAYLPSKFEGEDVKALLDTRSSATIISKAFYKNKKIAIPKCEFRRNVTLANGT